MAKKEAEIVPELTQALLGAIMEVRKAIKLNIDELAQDKSEGYTQGLVGGYRSCLQYLDENLQSVGFTMPQHLELLKTNALYGALNYGLFIRAKDGHIKRVEARACALKCDALKRLGLAIIEEDKPYFLLPEKYGQSWALTMEELREKETHQPEEIKKVTTW